MNSQLQFSGATGILVLGMHRSGTSATTRVLNLLGAELGPSLLEAQDDNTKGFWEHHGAFEIHEKLLSALDRGWHDVREMPINWLQHPAAEQAKKEIVELIQRDFADAKLWAVKDPRMCRLAPLWIAVLQELDIRPVIAMVVRNPREVADSLSTRDGWTYPHSYLMWAQHFLESARAIGAQDKAIICYDDLLENWAANMRRVGAQLRIEWPRSIEDAASDIRAFLSPGDRHHHYNGAAEQAGDPETAPALLMQLYEQCRTVANGADVWPLVYATDTQYKFFNECYARIVEELVSNTRHYAELSSERMERIHALEKEIALEMGHIHELEEEVARESEELTEHAREKALKEVRYAAELKKYQELLGQHQVLIEQHQALQLHSDELSRQAGETAQALSAEQARVVDLKKSADTFGRSRLRLIKRIWQITVRRHSAPDLDFLNH